MRPASSSPTDGAARAVTSNQHAPHPRLAALVARHRARPYRRPCPEHAAAALETLAAARTRWPGALIIDSGCGTGESSVALAEQHPQRLVVGADRSAARLARAARRARPANLLYLRLDLVDLWCGIRARGWPVHGNYLLYPNPWPKQHQLARRWHAHAVAPVLLGLGGDLELRTNWPVYAQEFALAARLLGVADAAVEPWQPSQPGTAFERKYLAAGQALYRVRLTGPGPR